MRLVYYSLGIPPSGLDPICAAQLDASIHSLRAHNEDIRVLLCAYGVLPKALEQLLTDARVEIVKLGAYEPALRAHLPVGAPPLAMYRVLHKWLCLPELMRLNPTQILYVDSDTYFFDDVGKLFARYAEADFYTREEPFSRRSLRGYDPGYLDEDALRELAQAEGAAYVAPANLGVCVMNHQQWERIAAALDAFLDRVWRLMIWMHAHPVAEGDLPSATKTAVEAELSRSVESRPPLSFPSSNRWIAEQIALCLTLGQIGVRQGFLSPDDVLQGDEFRGCQVSEMGALICHYFTRHTGEFITWLSEHNARVEADESAE